jgi:hypothetical protein
MNVECEIHNSAFIIYNSLPQRLKDTMNIVFEESLPLEAQRVFERMYRKAIAIPS